MRKTFLNPHFSFKLGNFPIHTILCRVNFFLLFLTENQHIFTNFYPVGRFFSKYELDAPVLAQDQFGNFRLAKVIGVKSEEVRVGKGTRTVYIYEVPQCPK